jgi:hypothetical protein
VKKALEFKNSNRLARFCKMLLCDSIEINSKNVLSAKQTKESQNPLNYPNNPLKIPLYF